MVKFAAIEKVLEMKENNESFKLVDVLSEDSFNAGHIPGAINIPLDKLKEQAPEKFDNGEKVVVYCGSYKCTASTKAARKLEELGYSDVLDFKGGKKLWKESGLELEQ